MATNDNNQAQEPQPQGRICYGDCFRCSYQQAWMCASMHARRTMHTTEELMEAISILTQTVTELKAQVSDLQAKFDKAELINPMVPPEPEPLQEGIVDIEDDPSDAVPEWAKESTPPVRPTATDGARSSRRKR